MAIIKPGCKVRIIGSHEEFAEGQHRPVVGAGPNVGLEGTVIEWAAEFPVLDNLWLVDVGRPAIVLFWGSVVQQARFSQHVLEVIDDTTIKENETERYATN